MREPSIAEMSDGAVRIRIGLSTAAAAHFARVSRATIRMYEASPRAVRQRTRNAIKGVYRILRKSLSQLQELRQKRGGIHGQPNERTDRSDRAG